MRPSPRRLLLIALPALLGGWLVLHLAGLGPRLLALHGAVTLGMVILALAGALALGRGPLVPTALGLQVAACLVCLLPLLSGGARPARWVQIGPMNLYVAAGVVPAALVAFERLTRWRSPAAMASAVLMMALGLMLALQPDGPQVLALALCAAVMVPTSGLPGRLQAALLGGLGSLVVLAFLQPDSLRPVPHVEGVFSLAFQHGWAAGLAVLLGALAFVGGLFNTLRAASPGLGGLAIYYASLFAGSLAGRTPAPLVGWGAGPLLGYGLLAAFAASLAPPRPGAA